MILYQGVGAIQDLKDRYLTRLTGNGPSGCNTKIKEVYKASVFTMLLGMTNSKCIKACCKPCPSRDEIFLFGHSRGGFIVRLVAGMLYHLHALLLDPQNFDRAFQEGWGIYRAARSQSQLEQQRHSVLWFWKRHTRASAKIRFLGCFDTMKAFDDNDLNGVALQSNVLHVRHALALPERATALSPERFHVATQPTHDHTVLSYQEAWF
ncbi:uncharacterized protein Z519_11628 [Cladophialophora bantiana CBS 173.52]|uniref:T6SS Phospholipase effector Tle1-like catalytic domain-containing protein n=1 Tax=Cladophialophora bantiana (strain ATCC 10958 / CBS 173.52 / CDC B-1940 / NIH 8579) TaxID=1442370 RepID=A0A0D2HT84_CLAB1|nr:uncharacterized protein Z519_11628 [Cladophialophora bantiana CBS 173.52]KIW87654.1 hypothetical protein Z519_11628 [Cladophialophora bantiana CBS 173.52]